MLSDPLVIVTAGFSEASIEQVVEAEPGPPLTTEEPFEIASFSQPFPLRVRDKPITDGEMDSYGQDTAAIRFHG